MKYSAICVLALSVTHSSVSFAEGIPKDQAQASAYFEAIVAGDVEKANALIGVPFSLDRKSILTTKGEVEAVHKQIAERKGKRPVPKYTIVKTDKAPKLEAAVFSKYVAFRLVQEDKEWIDIYVSIDESPKVIGFSD